MERVLRLDPAQPGALRAAAKLRQRRGERKAAAALWARRTQARPEDAEAWTERAWLAFHDGRVGEAVAHAERAVAVARGEPEPFGTLARAQSLLAHGRRGSTPAGRHVAICGTAHCGSTLTGFLLGSAPGVENVGESFRLTWRRAPERGRHAPLPIGAEDTGDVEYCFHCGPACPYWTWEFRRELAADGVDWFRRIAERLDAGVLVSSDKNWVRTVVLDPWLRFDVLVLFRQPERAWASMRRRTDVDYALHEYLDHWDEQYARIVFDLPNRGRKVFVDFDRFRLDPPAHLERLVAHLGLPEAPEALSRIERAQHPLGGNGRAWKVARGESRIERRDAVHLPDEERAAVADFAARSRVLAALRRGHEELFAGLGDGAG